MKSKVKDLSSFDRNGTGDTVSLRQNEIQGNRQLTRLRLEDESASSVTVEHESAHFEVCEVRRL